MDGGGRMVQEVPYAGGGVVDLTEAPMAEITGPESMYIPTTQIKIEPHGPWHRRSALPTETACGQVYAACASREYELEGDLCTLGCFSRRELELAAHPHLLQQNDTDEEP